MFVSEETKSSTKFLHHAKRPLGRVYVKNIQRSKTFFNFLKICNTEFSSVLWEPNLTGAKQQPRQSNLLESENQILYVLKEKNI